MEAYFDNSATTRCSAAAADLMMKVLREDFGNPSALHGRGMAAEQYIRDSRKKIAATLKAKEKEIFFTSGGTEANNLALVGCAMANRRSGRHLITTSIEHPSVENPMRYLEEQGFEVTRLGVDRRGVIDLQELREALRPDTILVSMMHVNNEIGAVEPIEEAAAVIRQKQPSCLFHVDAIQSYGKYAIYPRRIGVDLLSVSGHKIHGPKGSGFLYVREKTKIHPQILGGGQEGGMRSGTENVPAIAGLGEAAREMYDHLDENREYLYGLKQRFMEGAAAIPGVTLNGPAVRDGAPHIVSVSVDGVRSEVLLHALEEKGIYVSAGSACSSNKPSVSRTLKAIGLENRLLDATVRFSFSIENTAEEIDYALGVMGELIPVLSRFTRH